MVSRSRPSVFAALEWKTKARRSAHQRLGVELPLVAESAETTVEGNRPLCIPKASPNTFMTQNEKLAESDARRWLTAKFESPESDSRDESKSEDRQKQPPHLLCRPPQAIPRYDCEKKKRRRGRRGVVVDAARRKDASAPPTLPTQAFAEPRKRSLNLCRLRCRRAFNIAEPDVPVARAADSNGSAVRTAGFRASCSRAPVEPPAMQLPSERTAHGRAGDPAALASRMAQLESLLRRLVSSPLHRLDDVDHAPAGPGVFLLSDSDQISSYYIESCQTLRVGLGNLARGNRVTKNPRGGRGYSDSGLKSKLAEHLGIHESAKVPQYMKDHCVVRWLQMDDDAAHLAHFAIGVLRTPSQSRLITSK